MVRHKLLHLTQGAPLCLQISRNRKNSNKDHFTASVISGLQSHVISFINYNALCISLNAPMRALSLSASSSVHRFGFLSSDSILGADFTFRVINNPLLLLRCLVVGLLDPSTKLTGGKSWPEPLEEDALVSGVYPPSSSYQLLIFPPPSFIYLHTLGNIPHLFFRGSGQAPTWLNCGSLLLRIQRLAR